MSYRSSRLALVTAIVALVGCLMASPVLAAGTDPPPPKGNAGAKAAADMADVVGDIMGWGVALCACFLVLAVALGGLEGAIGEAFQIPGLRASIQTRIVLGTLALAVAVFAVPLSNALVRAIC